MTEWGESLMVALTPPVDREFEVLKRERTGYWFDCYDNEGNPVSREIWKLLEPYGALDD